MLKGLLILITKMSAVLGIIIQNPLVSSYNTSDDSIKLLDHLFQKMYLNNSELNEPSSSMKTEEFDKKADYGAILRNMLLAIPKKRLEDEKIPRENKQTQEDLLEKKLRLIALMANATLLSNSEQLPSNFTPENYSSGNETEFFQGQSKTNFKERSMKNEESSKENVCKNIDDNMEKNILEIAKNNITNNSLEKNSSEQISKLKELNEIGQLLKQVTHLMEQQPMPPAEEKSATRNLNTNERKKGNSLETDNSKMGAQNLQSKSDSSSSSTLKAPIYLTDLINILRENKSVELLYNKPGFKNSPKSINKNYKNDTNLEQSTSDQNIELVQNFFSYRKIPYPLFPVQTSSTNCSVDQSELLTNLLHTTNKYNKQKHSWIHTGSSNSSFHLKNSPLDPIRKTQIQLERATEKSPNLKSSSSDFNSWTSVVHNTSERHSSRNTPTTITTQTIHSFTPSLVLNPDSFKLFPPDINANSISNTEVREMLQKCWLELNKTKTAIKLQESQKAQASDAITCIIPRQNTSILCASTTEPEDKGSRTGCFGRLFNKKEKKEKKKKMCTTRTMITCSAFDIKQHPRSTTTTPSHKFSHEQDCDKDRGQNQNKSNECNEGQNHEQPHEHEHTSDKDHDKDHNHDKEHEVYDARINKILEDISSKMCLPNMINKLLQLASQNGSSNAVSPIFNCSGIAPHNVNNNHSCSSSKTRLHHNEYKAKWANETFLTSRLYDSMKNPARFQEYPFNKHFDTNSIRAKKVSKQNADIKDLSNLIFLIGVDRNDNPSKNNIRSRESFRDRKVDIAYMKS